MRLAPIAASDYPEYRLAAIFSGFKWDPQVEDVNTLSDHVLLLDRTTANELAATAEALARETAEMECLLLNNPEALKELGIDRAFFRPLLNAGYTPAEHIRLMRFDFHPVAEGFALSEVNSDVPGGFAETDALPRLAAPYFPGYAAFGDVGEALVDACRERGADGRQLVGMVHATSYSDDRQVMEYLGSRFLAKGMQPVYIAPEHVRWHDGAAFSLAEGQEGRLGCLLRFFPAEWFTELGRGYRWQEYFNSRTPSCNHPVAIMCQSKRLPLVWDRLGHEARTWRRVLPETRTPKLTDSYSPGWVLKPTWGRVGELILIPEALTRRESRLITLNARLFPREWVKQKRFFSQPLESVRGPQHICIGVYTVNGKACGLYGRAAMRPRIDSLACDLPVLVAESSTTEEAT